MNVDDFDFDLPAALVAQEPAGTRDQSRLLVLYRDGRPIIHTTFSHLPDFLRRGDLMVVNDTRVFPARLLGHRVPSGGAVECLLLSRLSPTRVPTPPLPTPQFPPTQSPLSRRMSDLEIGTGEVGPSEVWSALVHPGQKLKPGARMLFERDGIQLHGEILARHFHGRRTIRLWADAGNAGDVTASIDRIGHIPLPPYIRRDDRPADRERYQTVYARERGSIAAPTAGLHFSPALLERLVQQGIERAEVTLHVGYGTFKPIHAARVEDHVVDPEPFAVSAPAAEALSRARQANRRVIAVGTTTVRALESLRIADDGSVSPIRDETHLAIYPGHQFRMIDGLITNFHLPRSSLLMLVAAFAGRERLLSAYREAVASGYRFYSYGDAMAVF